MARSFARLTVLILLAAFFCQPARAQGDSLQPHIPRQPVYAPVSQRQAVDLPVVKRSLGAFTASLKAVVFSGPIDGENGSWTLAEIANARQAAAALRSYGVSVEEFYPNQPNGTWANIKAAANGANFIIYRGHGVSWSDLPYPIVGGFYLKNDVFVSNEMIRSELHPAKNFLVMLYGCFTAGSSGDDPISIDVNEAKRRVAMYSDPFFDIGAAGYYADWFGEAFPSYIHALFAGKTQREAYESFYDYDSGMTWRGSHPDHPSFSLWLGWDNWYAPLPNWNNAFAGDAEKTLADLFDTRMVLSARRVSYLAEPAFPARSFSIYINSSSETAFDWRVNSAALPAWLSLVGPTEGSSGAALELQIDPTQAGGVESITLEIEATSPEVGNSTQTITAALRVVEHVGYHFLPLATR